MEEKTFLTRPIKIILISTILLLTALLLVIVGNPLKKPPAPTPLPAPQINKNEISADANNSEVKDWEAYVNKEYGFELKYPKDFSKFEVDSVGTVDSDRTLFWLQLSSPKTDGGYPSIAINIPPEHSLDEAINNYIKAIETTVKTEQKAEIDNIVGKIITISSNNPIDAKRSLFVVYKTRVYQIQFFDRDLSFEEKFPSTFKFIKLNL